MHDEPWVYSSAIPVQEPGELAPEGERPEDSVPWWFVALVMVILWGPLAGAVVRPYRYPD